MCIRDSRHVLDEAALPQMAERFAQLAVEPGAALVRPLPQPRLVSSAVQQAETLDALGIERPERPVPALSLIHI